MFNFYWKSVYLKVITFPYLRYQCRPTAGTPPGYHSTAETAKSSCTATGRPHLKEIIDGRPPPLFQSPFFLFQLYFFLSTLHFLQLRFSPQYLDMPYIFFFLQKNYFPCRQPHLLRLGVRLIFALTAGISRNCTRGKGAS